MSTQGRRLVAILSTAILAVGGIVWVLWLLFSVPQVNAFAPPEHEECYGIFQLPRNASDPADRRYYTNQGALIGLQSDDMDELVRNADDCSRERSQRLALSIMVAIPTSILGSAAVSLYIRRRPEAIPVG